MSKKKLTRKRKKQLLAMFMATGMMAQSLISTGMVLAEETTDSQAVTAAAADTKETSSWDVPLTTLGKPQNLFIQSILSDKTKMSFDGRSMTFNNGSGGFASDGYKSLRLYVSNSIPNKNMPVYDNYGIYLGYGKEIPNDAEMLDAEAIRAEAGSASFTLTDTQLQIINSYKYVYLGNAITVNPYLGQQANVSDLYINAPTNAAPVYVHYLSDAGEYLEPMQTLEGKIGESYTTEAKEFEGYTLSIAPENPSGIFSETEQNIAYIYTKTKEVNYIHAEDGEVEYGSEWNETVALKAANVVAIDANGNDVTSTAGYIYLDSTPVDTKKPGKYKIKFIVPKLPDLVSEPVTITVKEPEIIGDVTVNYVDEEGNKVAESDVLKGEKYGDAYETTPKEIKGYQVKETPKNANGTFSGEAQTVTYIYEKVETEAAPVTVKYVDTDGKELVDAETLNGTIGDSYETQAKEINGYVLKETPENAKGTFSEEAQTVTYVYEKAEAAPVTVKYVDTDGKELVDAETLNGTIGDSYETQAKEIDGYVLKETPENANGTFSEEAQTVTYVYEKAEAAPVTVKYVDTDGKELVDAETLNGTIGDSYETQAKEIDGYVLKETPENANGTFSEEAQTVTYVYEKAEAAPVTVKYVDTDGKELVDAETLNGKIGDSYETQAKEIDGYVLKETPENAKGTFSDKAQTVTYVYEADVDHKLTANKFTIGKDTYVTGTAGADIGFVDLYVNGVFAKRAQVSGDGSYKVYGTAIQNKEDDVKVVALDTNKKPIAPEVSVKVPVALLGEEDEFKLKANDYTLGEAYVTGTYDNDKADRVKLLVDGKVVKQNVIGDSESDQFSLNVAGFITGIDDHVYEIAEYKGSTLISRTPINVKEKEVVDYGITADDYTIGEKFITGTWTGDKESTHAALRIDGQIVKLVEVKADGTYELAAKGYVTSPDQEVEVILYNKTTKQIFSTVKPLVKVDVTANPFTIGVDGNITGTYDSRHTNEVDSIRLMVDGVATKLVKYNALPENEQNAATEFKLAAKSEVTDRSKKYVIEHLKDGKVYSKTDVYVK